MARTSAVLVGVVLGALLLAAPAMAQYPPAEDTTGVVSTTSVLAGGQINVAGDGWLPGSTVSFSLLSTGAHLGTASVDGDGEFSATVTIPAGTPAGAQTLRISGTGGDGQPRTVDIAITVIAGATTVGSLTGGTTAADGSALAATGGPVTFSTTSALGALLLVIGAGALFASRRLTKAGGTSNR